VLRPGRQQAGRVGDAGQDQQARRIGAARALDVGVEAVPDDQRPSGARAADALRVHGRVRLAGDQRGLTGHVPDDADHGPVAGQRTARRGDRGVGIRGDVPGAPPHRDHRLGELGPADVASVSLDDRDRLVLGTRDHGQARGRQRCGHPGSADREHPRTGSEHLRHHGGRRLGAGDDVLRLGRDPERRQVLGHILRRARRVVGHEPQAHAGCPDGAEGSGHARHRVGTHVDDAVEVEQRDVVDLRQRVAAAGEQRAGVGGTGRVRRHADSAACRARTPRSARA
jgi:hypothetical protein